MTGIVSFTGPSRIPRLTVLSAAALFDRARNAGFRAREELFMAIEWGKDVDAALRDAARSKRPLLLDFSAAPM
ncbi:MAG: hypothetical protein ABR576_16375 [Thermoanaerobaculia bacterium]